MEREEELNKLLEVMKTPEECKFFQNKVNEYILQDLENGYIYELKDKFCPPQKNLFGYKDNIDDEPYDLFRVMRRVRKLEWSDKFFHQHAADEFSKFATLAKPFIFSPAKETD